MFDLFLVFASRVKFSRARTVQAERNEALLQLLRRRPFSHVFNMQN
jgi:hypothetical protein